MMMSLRNARTAVAVLAAATLLATGVIFTLHDARGQSLPAVGATGVELQQKAQARVEAAEKVLAGIEARERAEEALTPAFVDLHALWLRRLAEARIDATDDPVERLRAAEQCVQQCRDMLEILKKRGTQDVTRLHVAQAAYYVADAEYRLAKMQGK